MAQLKNVFSFQWQNQTVHFTLISFRMYSRLLRFQQNKSKNHSNGMNEHKNVKGDQT